MNKLSRNMNKLSRNMNKLSRNMNKLSRNMNKLSRNMNHIKSQEMSPHSRNKSAFMQKMAFFNINNKHQTIKEMHSVFFKLMQSTSNLMKR